MVTTDDLDAMAKALSAKERAFAEAYAGTARARATRAAEIAGYKPGPGLKVTACRLLAKPPVREYIDALLAIYSAGNGEVIREISEIAFQDLTPYLKIQNRELVLDYEAMKEDGKLHLVAGFEFNKAGDCIPVIHSKMAALTLLVRVLGMGSEKVEHEMSGVVTVREYPEGV